jgi:hypothetical protein
MRQSSEQKKHHPIDHGKLAGQARFQNYSPLLFEMVYLPRPVVLALEPQTDPALELQHENYGYSQPGFAYLQLLLEDALE